MRSAVASGRYAQMWENRETHPYWQYIAILDNRTRPHHRAINGVIKAADDAFWQSNYPPNGFNCRCTVRALTADAAQSRGGISENTAPFQPDEGFSHSPIQAATIEKIWVEKAKNEPELLRQIAKDLTSEPRVAGFNAFIRTAQRNGYAQNRAYAVGLLDAKAAEKLGADNPLVVFLDKLISGRKVERHSAAENNLKDADFERIIRQFAHADYTLWDTRNRHLLLIFRQPETKNVIKLSLNNVDKETRVISAFSVPEYTVTDAIKSREFVPIE